MRRHCMIDSNNATELAIYGPSFCSSQSCKVSLISAIGLIRMSVFHIALLNGHRICAYLLLLHHISDLMDSLISRSTVHNL